MGRQLHLLGRVIATTTAGALAGFDSRRWYRQPLAATNQTNGNPMENTSDKIAACVNLSKTQWALAVLMLHESACMLPAQLWTESNAVIKEFESAVAAEITDCEA